MTNNSTSMKKFLATATTAAIVASAVAPAALAAELTDIQDYEFKAEIDALVADGIIGGYPDGTFKPYKEITRGEAAIMIARAKGLLTEKDIPTNNFSDLDKNQASYEAVLKLVEAKVISGYPDGTFRPAEKITRAQMAKYIANAYNLPVADGETDFADVDASQELAKYVDAVVEAGIADGYKDGNYGYADPLKRGHFAKMVHKAENLQAAVAVESVTAENGKLTVKLAEAVEEVKAADFKVTQAINGEAATNVTPSAVELSEDGKTVVLMVPEVAKTEAEQSVVFTVNTVAAEAITVDVSTVKVTEVKALNAKQVAVTFNTAMDFDSLIADVKTKTLVDGVVNISAVSDAEVHGSVTGELSEDGKTLTLTAANHFDGRYNVTIAGAESANGAELEDYTNFVDVDDTVSPTISDVTYTNGKTAKITFSEPIQDWGTVSFNDTELELADAAKGLDYILVDLSSLDYEEAAKVTIVGAKDYAGNIVSTNPTVADVTRPAKDETAPVVESMNVVSETLVKVVFSEELESATFEVNGTPVPTAQVSKDQDTVTHYLNVDLVDGVNKIEVTAFTDTAENDGVAVARQFIVKLDKVAPEINDFKVIKEDGKEFLQLTLSEAVDLDRKTKQSFTGKLVVDHVTDTNASFEAVPVVDKDDNTKVNIPLQDAKKGSWTINLPEGFVNDLSQAKNDLKAREVAFERGEDDKAEAADITVTANPTGNVVTVSFTGKIDGAAANNKENYSVEGAEVESAVLTYNEVDGATVELKFVEGTITANGPYQLNVSGLTSAEGASIEADPINLQLTENIAPTLESATLVNGKDINLTFSEKINTESITDNDDFNLLIGDEEFAGTFTIAQATGDTTGTKFVLTLDADKNTDGVQELNAEQLEKAITLELKDAADIVDMNDNELTAFESLAVVLEIN